MPCSRAFACWASSCCAANFEKRSDACIEWTLENPIPARWWHGRLESDGSTGWANREFRVAIRSGLDPDVMVKTNYTGYREGGDQRTANFYMDGPLTGLQVEPAAAVRESMLLRHDIKGAPKSMATEHALMTTVDYEQMETGTLELIGTNLKGEVPTFATYPQGRKIAVVTMWDDGKKTDLRAAEILHKNGYRATFLMNENSPALDFLEELKALNGEIGGHSMTHPALHNVSPTRAFDEAAEIRKLLERKLGHPGARTMEWPRAADPRRCG